MGDVKPFHFRKSFMLGVSTAATQVEGFPTENSWYDWAKLPGKIRDNSNPGRANGHWEHWKEDLDLMADMGIRHYRLGLEWSRIEPRDGVFDANVIRRYRDELTYMQKLGIRPLITLHHFANPSWFEHQGAFEHKRGVDKFRRYVRRIVPELTDLCSDFVTINEANVYAANGYLYGIWPPGRKSLLKAFSVMRNLSVCHLRAYEDIHDIYAEKPVQVGYANHMRIFRARGDSKFGKLQSKILETLFQGSVTRLMTTGRSAFPAYWFSGVRKSIHCDFIGINYYARCTMQLLKEVPVPNHVPHNDLGWEIYPDGLRLLCEKYHALYKKPIWITENGTCDAKDTFRSGYIYDHLNRIALHLPFVARYYHWTFIDNFEWAEGENAPFGLVQNHFPTQQRVIRESGRFYSEIIRENGVTQSMIDRYLSVKSEK